ncbi:unnamed protein product, partial [Symbiodinium necroappetens]
PLKDDIADFIAGTACFAQGQNIRDEAVLCGCCRLASMGGSGGQGEGLGSQVRLRDAARNNPDDAKRVRQHINSQLSDADRLGALLHVLMKEAADWVLPNHQMIPAAAEGRNVFLQVVKRNPSAQHRVRAADALAKQLSHLDVCVAVHSTVTASADDASVSLLPQRQTSGSMDLLLFDPPRVQSIPEAMEGVTEWTETQVDTRYVPKGLPLLPEYLQQEASTLVSHMARMQAIVGSPRETALVIVHSDEGAKPQLAVLERFLDYGLVQSEFLRDDSSGWLLSKDALSHLSLQLQLRKPEPVFSRPGGPPALTWSRMQLLCFLHSEGWECHFLTDKEDKNSVLPLDLSFRTSDDKCIYVLQGTLHRRYLTVLAFADAGLRLCTDDSEEPKILHFEPLAYYDKLLGLDVATQKKTRHALQDAGAVPANAFQRPEVDSNPLEFQPELSDMPLQADAAPGDDVNIDAGGIGSPLRFEDDFEGADAEELMALFDSDDEAKEASGSSSGSSKSSSSSSSSSSDSSGDSNDAGDDPDPNAEAPAAPVDRRRPRPEQQDEAPPAARQRRDETFEWRGFRFTFRPGGQAKNPAYMVLCRYHSRSHMGTRCTRTLSYASEADKDLVLRKLKSWCVRAADYEYTSPDPQRLLHQQYDRAGANVLTDAELEAAALPPLPSRD